MSTQSWRSVGGYSNYSQLNNMNTNNLSADTLSLRQAYVGLFQIDGILKVSDYAYFYSDVMFYGNTHSYNRMYLGPADEDYLYGTASGIGINTQDASYTLDVRSSSANVLNVQTTAESCENFLARVPSGQKVAIGADLSTSFLRFYDSSAAAISELRTLGDNIYITTRDDMVINSRVIVGNKDPSAAHLDTEIMTVMATQSDIFHYDLFGNSSVKTGTVLTGLARDNMSTAFVTVNAPNGQGAGFGGGILPNDETKSYACLGTYDASGYYTISQAIVCGPKASQSFTKKSCVAFNNVAPEYGNYILDINGPIHLREGEINLIQLAGFEVVDIQFNGARGIAVGSPSNAGDISGDELYSQYVWTTENGGISWTQKSINSGQATDELALGPYFFNGGAIQDASLTVVAGSNNFMYMLSDASTVWQKLTYTDNGDYVLTEFTTDSSGAAAEAALQTITTTACYVKGNVIFGGFYNTVDSSARGFYYYLVDTGERTKIEPFGAESNYSVTYVAGADDTIFFVGNCDGSGIIYETTFDFSTNILTLVDKKTYAGVNFQYCYVDDMSAAGFAELRMFAIGSNIVYKDRGGYWQQSAFDMSAAAGAGEYLYGMDFLDEKNGLAVGSAGTFIYTKDGGVTWDDIPNDIINAYGNADVLTNARNVLKHVYIYDKDTFVVTFFSTEFSLYETAGETKMYHCYMPTLFDRSSVYLLDVCGGVRVTGDILTTDGGDVFVDGDEYVRGELVTNTRLHVGRGTETYFNYVATVGDIDDPALRMTEGTLRIQGQNGHGNFHTWSMAVGTTAPNTSSYDTNRLRIIDESKDGAERATIDQNGWVGISTKTPVSTLDISGITTVTATYDSESTTSGSLQVRGGAGIVMNLYVAGHLIEQNTTETYSTDTGAVQVTGGVGIAKALYMGGNIIISKDEVSTSPYTGALQVRGGAGVQGSVNTGGNVTIWDDTASTDPYTGSLIVGGGAGIAGSLNMGGNITIWDDTTSINPYTGALIILGGAGIQGSLNMGGNVTIWDTTAATDPYTGSLIVAGGAGITGNVFVEAQETVYGTITSRTGVEVAHTDTNTDYYLRAGTISAPAQQVSQGTLYLQGQNGLNNFRTWALAVGTTEGGTSSYDTERLRIIDYTADRELMTFDSAGQIGIDTATPSAKLDVSGTTLISAEYEATTTTSGAFQVRGGASIKKSLYVGGNLVITNTEETYNTHSGALQVRGGLAVALAAHIGGNLIVDTTEVTKSPTTGAFQVRGGAGVGGSLYTAGNITIKDNTTSYDASSGALIVVGGAAVGGSLNITGNITLWNSTVATAPTTGALIVAGGAGISGSIFTAGNITIKNTTDADPYDLSAGALIVAGGAAITKQLVCAAKTTVYDTITSRTGVEVTYTDTNTDYYFRAGTISAAATQVSQGSFYLQGQNGLNNYRTWSIAVGTTESGTSSYDTERLRIIDSTAGEERATIDSAGQMGIATATPAATLDVSGSARAITLKITSAATIAATTFTGAVTAQKDIYARANLDVSGDTTMGGNLAVASTVDLSAVVVAGGATINKSLTVGGNIVIGSTLFAKDVSASGLISAQNEILYGWAAIGGNLAVGGSTTVGGDISATGNATVSNNLTVGGWFYVGGDLSAADTIYSAAAKMSGTISVGSISTPNTEYSAGEFYIQGQNGLGNYRTWSFSVGSATAGAASYDTERLRITDATAGEERVTIDAAGQVGIATAAPAATLDVSGSAQAITLKISGAATFAGAAAFSGAISTTNSVSVGGILSASGDTFIDGNVTAAALTVSGATTIKKSLTVGGNITAAGTAAVTDMSATGLITGQNEILYGWAAIGGNLAVGGATTLSDDMTTSGNVTLKKNLTIAESCSVGADLSAVGTVFAATGEFSAVAVVGSISAPTTTYSAGELLIQGQNGQSNYHTWSFTVGATAAGTSSYDTARLRLVDYKTGTERATFDNAGYFGLATAAPETLLDVSGAATVRGTMYLLGDLSASAATMTAAAANFAGDISAAAATLGSAEIVSATIGAATIKNSFGVSGETTLGGALTVSGNISAAAGAEFAGTVTVGALAATGNIAAAGGATISGAVSLKNTFTVAGDMAAAGNIVCAADISAAGTVTATALAITGSGNGKDYEIKVGSISNPIEEYSQGILSIQGENGAENIGKWSFKVGASAAGTSTFDCKRLRLEDIGGTERATITAAGYMGIGTTAPTTTLDVSGSITADGYYTSSDYRIKENITQLDPDYDTVDFLRPYKYYNLRTQKMDYGFLAHEIAEYYPFLVEGEKDGEQYQKVKYQAIIALLVREVQLLKREFARRDGLL